LEHHPHIMICDVQMPRMNGIEFLRRLLPQYSIPVIVVSALSSAVFDAMSAGAIDFISKPDSQLSNVESFINELIVKIKIAAKAKIIQHSSAPVTAGAVYSEPNSSSTKLIAIGASTGVTEAIYSLLRALPLDMPGIAVV